MLNFRVNEGNDLSMSSKFRIQVYQGFVMWIPGFRFETSCAVDLTYFPFDDQLCYLSFTSWSFENDMVALANKENTMDTTHYQTNGEWELVGTYAAQETLWNSVTFYLHLRRKPTFYLMNIVIPTLILSAVSLLVFALPADSGEKISLGISILLSYSVLMLIVGDIMPKSADTIPYLSECL